MLKCHICRVSKPVFPVFVRIGSSSGNNFSVDEVSVVTISILFYESPILTPNSKPRLPILYRSLRYCRNLNLAGQLEVWESCT